MDARMHMRIVVAVVVLLAAVVLTAATRVERSVSTAARGAGAALQPAQSAPTTVQLSTGPVSLPFTPFPMLPAADQAAFKKQCAFCLNSHIANAPAYDANLNPKRRRILEVAQQYLLGVSDCGGTPARQKWGANTLVHIYKEGLQNSYSDSYRNHLTTANDKWRTGPWSWCAIWATAVVRMSGITDMQWGAGKMVGRKPVYGSKGVQPGDIAFWQGGLNHHDIVEKVEGTTVWTLDGNQECSGIARKKRNISKMAGYYSTVP